MVHTLHIYYLQTSALPGEVYEVCPEKVQPLLIQREWFVWHRCDLAAKDSGLECACMNNDDFTVLVRGGGRPLSKHVDCVAVTLKMSERVEHGSASNFALSLNIPPQKLFALFRRPQLWAAGDWQLHHDYVPAHASCLVQRFLVKHPITQVTQPLYSPDLVPCDFWLFPKLKPPLKGKRFQTINGIQ